MNKPQKINSQEELDILLKAKGENAEPLEVFISFGFARSSKLISFTENDNYYVFNEIDDTDDIIEHNKFSESNIGKALSNGQLYKYNYG